MTMRLRVAGEDQLGSFTPRPQAPANCLASFQINESMLNNALQRLQLEDHTFTLPQLVQRISERFQRPNIWNISPDYEDLTITFAKKDAVSVRCQDGQVILTFPSPKLVKNRDIGTISKCACFTGRRLMADRPNWSATE